MAKGLRAAVAQGLAHMGRGELLARGILHRLGHRDAKAQVGAIGAHGVGAAAAVLAEGIVEADGDVARAEAFVQHGLRELSVAHLGQFRTQRQDVEDVDAQRLERAGLLIGLHQQEGGLARAEIDARMRVQRDDAERRAELAGRLGGQRDHLLVATVDAVEIAHGQGRAAIALRQVLPALNDSQASHPASLRAELRRTDDRMNPPKPWRRRIMRGGAP
jgi:hypothetical protein